MQSGACMASLSKVCQHTICHNVASYDLAIVIYVELHTHIAIYVYSYWGNFEFSLFVATWAFRGKHAQGMIVCFTVGQITFEDTKLWGFHRFLQNFENIYPWNCKTA